MRRKFFLGIVLISVLTGSFLISGCQFLETGGGGKGKVKVEIKKAEYKQQALMLQLDSSKASNRTRVEVVDEKGSVLCTKYLNLKEGINVKFLDCGIENNITVSVTPSGGEMITKSFNLGLPLLKLKEGMKYKYSGGLAFYLTKKTDKAWEGIITYKTEDYEGKKAKLFRFKLYRSNLSFKVSYPLGLDEIRKEKPKLLTTKELEDVIYDVPVAFLFPLSLLKTRGNTNIENLIETGSGSFSQGYGEPNEVSLSNSESHSNWLARKLVVSGTSGKALEAYISTKRPYPLIDIVSGQDVTLFTLSEVVKKQGFNESEVQGYTVEAYPEKKFTVSATCQETSKGEYIGEIRVSNKGRTEIAIQDININKLSGGPANITQEIYAKKRRVIEPGESQQFIDNGCNGKECRYGVTWSGMSKEVCVCDPCPLHNFPEKK